MPPLRPIHIVDVPRSSVSANPTSYNTARHPLSSVPPTERPPIYHSTSYHPWVATILATANFPPTSALILTLPTRYTRTLISAGRTACITGRIPESDLEDLLDGFPAPSPSSSSSSSPPPPPLASNNSKDKDNNSNSNNNTPAPLPHPPSQGWFLRTDLMSPKDTPQGTHPVRTALEILTRLSLSLRALGALERQLTSSSSPHPVVRLYLMPFNPLMNTLREFRIYCAPPTGHVSAISQYAWHRELNWSDEELEGVGVAVQEAHGEILWAGREEGGGNGLEGVLRREGFVFDMLFVGGEKKWQLVELNPFGALSGTGAALWNWVRDRDVLYRADGEGGIPLAVCRKEGERG